MSSESPQEITFRIGKRTPVALSRIEANEILGRAVERTVQATALCRMIESALQTGEEVVFVAGMDMVQDELTLCLEAIDHIREQGRTRVIADDIERISEAIKGQELWP